MDNKLKRKRIIILLIAFGLLLLFFSTYYYINETKDIDTVMSHVTHNEPIIFSNESGFYNNELNLKLSLDVAFPGSSKIYYTLDGNDPDSTSFEYTRPIKLSSDEEKPVVYPVKAVVLYYGMYSDIYERDYVIGKDVFHEFDTVVASLTVDGKNLYDEEIGIMVEKNLLNRDDEFYKKSKITIFNTSGKPIVEQNVKIGIMGTNSATQDIKSFKIKVDKEYNEDIKFVFNETDSRLALVDEYKSLKLRSGSQDRTKGNIRESVFSQICYQSNFDGYAKGERCVLFLNGQFYGIFDIEQNYSKSFLGDRYGIEDNDNIVKIEESDIDILKQADVFQYFTADLNDVENRKQLESHVDIDNYITYFAIQLLSNNVDWPKRNIAAWYYSGNDVNDNKYTDGKLRYLLYDMDFSLYTPVTWEAYGFEDWDVELVNRLQDLLNTDCSLKYILQSKYYRDKFIVCILDLLNTSFSDKNLISVIDNEFSKISSANEKFLSKEACESSAQTVYYMKRGTFEIKENVINSIESEYGLKEKYDFEIACSSRRISYVE